MILDLPYWFKQRQVKAEEIGAGAYKCTGPNLPEGVVAVRLCEPLRWQGVLKSKADGPELSTTEPEFKTAKEALAAAFELYRRAMILG